MDRLAKLLTITDKEEMQDVINQEKLLKSYYNKLSYLSDDSEYRKGLMNENIERTMEFVDSYNDGLNDGWHQGMDKAKEEMVIKMHGKNIDLETISECTNLNIEKVQEIIDNIDNHAKEN